jgi:hypothetical protein
MPFDIGESINSIADTILRAPVVGSIARNPIYTAIFTTFVTVIIVMIIFRDADTDESLLVMCLRSGFWVFMMMIGTLFLHNKVLMGEVSAGEKSTAYENVFQGGYDNAVLEDYVVPVAINTDFTNM